MPKHCLMKGYVNIMKFLSAAASEVARLLDLLETCTNNGDMVRAEGVNITFKNIAKIYANNAKRTPQASQAHLEALLANLTAKVLACNVTNTQKAADAIARQYAMSVKLQMDTINATVGGGEDEGTELADVVETPEVTTEVA